MLRAIAAGEGILDNAARSRRGALQRSWDAGVGSGRHGVAVRPEVRSSWERSGAVSLDLAAAPVSSPEDVVAAWAASPLGRASRIILDDLADLASSGDMMAAITDAELTIAWIAGGRSMSRRADRVHFSVGGCWAEEVVGTNALALAGHLARPATVLSAEHYSPMVHEWVCYSAPIIDPASGDFLGVLDLSTVWNRAHPTLLTTVGALARCVEYELAAESGRPVRTSMQGPTTHQPLELRTLGPCDVRIGETPLPVTRRQLELLTVLSFHPDGLTLDELTGKVYGDHPVSRSTVKAELSHLRHLLGGRIGSRPYRLVAPVATDHHRLVAALASGDVAQAVGIYRGPLLSSSDSPEIEWWRHHIDVALRDAVLSSGEADLLYRLGEILGDDADVHRATLGALPRKDPRHSVAAGRLAAATRP